MKTTRLKQQQQQSHLNQSNILNSTAHFDRKQQEIRGVSNYRSDVRRKYQDLADAQQKAAILLDDHALNMQSHLVKRQVFEITLSY